MGEQWPLAAGGFKSADVQRIVCEYRLHSLAPTNALTLKIVAQGLANGLRGNTSLRVLLLRGNSLNAAGGCECTLALGWDVCLGR